MQDWSGFFQAELGAAAALAGLVIVAISINVSRILSDPTLPGRAAETLVSPSGVLIACSFALVPHQPGWVLGSELIVTGAAMAAAPAVLLTRLLRSSVPVHWGYFIGRAILALLSCLPFLVAGVLLWQGASSALYWMVPGIIVALLATVVNAWVLLVEILR
jgi:hypothetical protein